MDQFQSTQVGFIAQLKGKLTTQWYQYGTVFINHFSLLRYVCFMTDQSSAQMLKAKQAYEQLASKLGLNLGPSPHHACNVNLVLNLDTGLVSPQFDCQFDDFFETISLNKPETTMSSNWQIFAGLERPDKTPTVKQGLQSARPPQHVAHDFPT
ncbi:hypothetical protein ACHAW6_007014 [Cyclotella cf. meneghiniana]